MLEPMTLPMPMSGASSRLAATATTISGMEVAAATTVMPTKSGESPRRADSDTDPRSSTSPPKTSNRSPPATMQSARKVTVAAFRGLAEGSGGAGGAGGVRC